MVSSLPITALREQFGSALQENVNLANYTTARVGGPVDALLPVNSEKELEQAARVLCQLEIPFKVLGSGSNLLVSDDGLRGVVVLNHARNIKINSRSDQPSVWAESGANFGTISRQAALRGLSGLEWAATIPGSLGGAVFNNAGAYGGDMNSSLIVADILHLEKLARESWTAEDMQYAYRSSRLKREKIPAVILSARLSLSHGNLPEVQAKMEANSEHRRRTQPPGASMGSMFKNPPGDYAGRLIEAAGLKGLKVGGAEISPLHANFFINHGHASAKEIWTLICQARATVYKQFGILLDLEVELVGNWPDLSTCAGEK